MFNNLIGLGIGVIGFALIVGVGTIVLQNFGDSIATCPAYNASPGVPSGVYNASLQQCHISNSSLERLANPSSTAWGNIAYMNTQLGTSGLAGWTPAVIAFTVGMMFFGGILVYMGKGRQY